MAAVDVTESATVRMLVDLEVQFVLPVQSSTEEMSHLECAIRLLLYASRHNTADESSAKSFHHFTDLLSCLHVHTMDPTAALCTLVAVPIACIATTQQMRLGARAQLQLPQ